MKSERVFGRVLQLAFICCLAVMSSGCDIGNDAAVVVDFGKRTHDSTVVHKHEDADGYRTLYFGFDLRSSVQEDVRQYQPLLDYLEEATGYHFHLSLPRNGQGIDERLGTGKVDFAAIGAVTHITATESYGVRPVVRGLNTENRAEYRSVIVVDPESTIGSVSELAGRRFAFGDESSTQGHLIPRIVLEKHGVKLSYLADHDYLGSHRECANAVISRRFDACGMQDTMGRALEEKGLVRIIHVSDYYPSSGISASPGISEEIVDKVREALLRFEPKGREEFLYNWSLTEMPNGFAEASDSEYRALREAMLRLGFLQRKSVE